ncbi:LOW QUALITY PROTEIN: eukaryotic translation initiation factor 5B-like [Asparagus officinalis]|uniref:LOW QUALITY PROTEIN: eukaryotic translation initiation factor 5B-like n=1 Tax=Asparagus officinalis TaxID=4686 RepID=UPI00098E1545|nr:LOW QUALITY PROTEIN: eukaryotic translation initiation factor 5B-like [Asparagus officinalis]
MVKRFQNDSQFWAQCGKCPAHRRHFQCRIRIRDQFSLSNRSLLPPPPPTSVSLLLTSERDGEEESAAAATKTKEEVEAEITKAMLSRLPDFKQQADNLTLEGVRRALEKDLGMEKLSLDAHKKFIKQCLEKYFYDADAKNASETEEKIAEEPAQPVREEVLQPEDLRNRIADLNESLRGSPALDEHAHADNETGKSHDSSDHGTEISEDMIKKAIEKRVPYLRSNLEITLGKLRRLLEEDLKLEKNSLDAFKKFISDELDAVLQSDEVIQATNGAKKESKKTSSRRVTGTTGKGNKKSRKDSDSSDSDDVFSDNEEEEEIKKPKKRPAQKLKADAKGSKRQKISAQKSKASSAGKKKPVDKDLEKSDESDGGKSEDDRSQSSGEEEEVKKKNEKPAQIYGKRVEHLKSIIKSCGIGIPPSIYKRVKQAPESKREAQLIKELEEILEKEGLSTDPSEKEIKAVKKRKERAKELEGIDMSNIVSSSRRRNTSSYIPIPKPKIEVESDEDEGGEEEEEDEDNEEDSDEGNNDEDSSEASDGGNGMFCSTSYGQIPLQHKFLFRVSLTSAWSSIHRLLSYLIITLRYTSILYYFLRLGYVSWPICSIEKHETR